LHFFVKGLNLKDNVGYIEKARALFDSYDSNVWIKEGFPELHISGFDNQTGGFVVYHREHNFDPTKGKFKIERGHYEKYASEVLSKYGMRVELFSEKKDENNPLNKKPDGFLNGKIFDIKGIEGSGNENVLKDMKDASKKGAEAIVLYYHDENLFSENQIRESYRTYLRNSQSKRIQHVYYIVNGKLYYLK